MLIDQSEIDALLSRTDALAQEAQAAPPPRPKPSKPAPASAAAPPEARRILQIRVPLVVRLAERKMSIEGVRRLAIGAIIEFEKSVEDDLDLLVNNRLIGGGTAVKVDEKFGLRITRIGNVARRIQSLGK